MNALKFTLLAVSVLLLSHAISSAQNGLTFFSDEVLFNQTCPGLAFEDFEPNNPGPDSLTFCSSPTINSMTDDECFSPEDLIPGFTVTSTDVITFPQSLLLVTPPDFGLSVAAVGSNVDGDDTITIEWE